MDERAAEGIRTNREKSFLCVCASVCVCVLVCACKGCGFWKRVGWERGEGGDSLKKFKGTTALNYIYFQMYLMISFFLVM